KFASVARNFKTNFKVVSLFGFQGSDPSQCLVFQGLATGSRNTVRGERNGDYSTGHFMCQHFFSAFFNFFSKGVFCPESRFITAFR
ncbi:MAG: hypothetical protein J6Y67_06825, partial [Lachnospiraceae bacterium]|nr:hypothetical protein [Lachnospiraceae bacterium]